MEIRQWDIVMADLSGAAYSEQGKKRPVIVVQNNKGNSYSPTTIAIPLSSRIKKTMLPTHAIVYKTESNGLKLTSIALCEQIRTIDKKRILYKIGCIDDDSIKETIIAANMQNYMQGV